MGRKREQSGAACANFTDSPVVVQNGDRSYIINAATSLFSNASLGSNDATNRQSIDPRFFNPPRPIRSDRAPRGHHRHRPGRHAAGPRAHVLLHPHSAELDAHPQARLLIFVRDAAAALPA